MLGRKKIASVVAEFLGTAVLAFVVINVSRSTIGIPYFVAIAAGMAIALVGVSMVSELHLNPAYTLALWTARRVKTYRAVAYIAAQLLGGWAAYGLYKYFVHGTVQHIPSTYEARILVAEAVGTFVFAFVAVGALYQKAHWLVRACSLGGAYAIGSIVASVASNGFINPAVALGSNGWAWGTYVLGPVLGAVIGVNLYGLLFAPEKAAVAKVAAADAPAKAKAKAKK